MAKVTIAKGDTLSGLATKHGTTVDALRTANPNIKDPNKIFTGASLNIPGAGGAPQGTTLPSGIKIAPSELEVTSMPWKRGSDQYGNPIDVFGKTETQEGEKLLTDPYGRLLPGVSMADLTKSKLYSILSQGSDPATATAAGSVEKSTGYEISKKIASMIGGTPQTAGLKPDTSAPFPNISSSAPAFNASQEEQKLATAYGLDHLQTQASQLDEQISQIQNDLITKQEAISGQPVSSRVMGKEASVASKQANAQLRNLRLQRSELTRSIATTNKAISMMMSAEKTDFSNAKSLWEFEYNKNIQYYNSLDKESKATDKQDKATLQGMLNMLGTGKTTLDELSPEVHNHIDELIMRTYGHEFLGLQNELPDGTAIYRKSITGVDGKKYLQSLYERPDGSFDVKYTTPATKTGKQSSRDDISTTESILRKRAGSDGYVSNEDFNTMRNEWVAGGHTATSFDSTFKNFVNPSHAQDYLLNKTKDATQVPVK